MNRFSARNNAARTKCQQQQRPQHSQENRDTLALHGSVVGVLRVLLVLFGSSGEYSSEGWPMTKETARHGKGVVRNRLMMGRV